MEKVTLFNDLHRVQTLSILVISDLHSEYMDYASLQTALRFFAITPKKRRRIFLLGDIFDMEFLVDKIEAYKRAKKAKDFDGYFVPEIEKEYAWWDWFLKKIIPLVNDYNCITFFEGNHEERLHRPRFNDFMLAEYSSMFNLPVQLRLYDLGINYIEYNDWLKIETEQGALALTHGIYCGANPIKKHVDVARCSVMFGHTHERGVRSFKTIDGTFMGYNNPCLCGTQPKYMAGKPHNWSVGFSTIQVTEQAFWVNQFTTYNGLLYDAHGRKV